MAEVIVAAVHRVLERTPPELAADVAESGLLLTGGGSLLRGLDTLLAQRTGMEAHVTAAPIQSVALGLLVVFLVFAVPSRYVSLGSVCAAASLPIQCALWGFPLISVAPIVVVALVVIWAHRSNIRKLARGEERRFAFHKDGEKPETGSDAIDGSDQGGAR